MKEEMKHKWYFSPMMPMNEEWNYLQIENEESLSSQELGEMKVRSPGEEYPIIPLKDLKDYMNSHPEILLYDTMVALFGDDELRAYLQEKEIKITNLDKLLKERGVKTIFDEEVSK